MKFFAKDLRLFSFLIISLAVVCVCAVSVRAQNTTDALAKKVEAVLKTDLGFPRPINSDNKLISAFNPEQLELTKPQVSVRVQIFGSVSDALFMSPDLQRILNGQDRWYEKGTERNYGTNKGVIAVMTSSTRTMKSVNGRTHVTGGASVMVLCGQLFLTISHEKVWGTEYSQVPAGEAPGHTRTLGLASRGPAGTFANNVIAAFRNKGLCPGAVIGAEDPIQEGIQPVFKLWVPNDKDSWCNGNGGYVDEIVPPPGRKISDAVLLTMEEFGGKVLERGAFVAGMEFDQGDWIETPNENGWQTVIKIPGTAIMTLEYATLFMIPCSFPTDEQREQNKIKFYGGRFNYYWAVMTGQAGQDFPVIESKEVIAGVKQFGGLKMFLRDPDRERDRDRDDSAFSLLTGWGSAEPTVVAETPFLNMAANVIDIDFVARDGKTRVIVRSGEIELTPVNRSLRPFTLRSGQEATVSQTSVTPAKAISPADAKGRYTGNVVGGEIKDDKGKTVGLINKTTPIVTKPTTTVACPVSSWSGEDNYSDTQKKNNGSSNGVSFAAGKSGQAFSFNGTNNYVKIPDSASLDITGELTIDAWIYVAPDAPQKGQMTIAGKYIGADKMRGYELSMLDQKLRLVAYSQGEVQMCDVRSAFPVPYAKWTHVAGTINSNLCTVYINGEMMNSKQGFSSVQQNNVPLYLGVHGNTEVGFFKGLIDEVGIYDRALPESEIAAIYSMGGKRNCGGNASSAVPGPSILNIPSVLPGPAIPTPPPPSAVANFAGSWSTQHGDMTLTQNGNRVLGNYNYAGGKIDGIVTGNILRFTWSQANDRNGTGTYYMQPDGKSFTGHWSYTGNPDDKSGGGWSGTRKN